MKKYPFFLSILLAALLTGCGSQMAQCTHQWLDADCVNPKTCTLCQLTEGEALGHDWTEADCMAPKTCTLCGTTEGEPAEHIWLDATCAVPKTCQVCAATEGECLPHRYDNWLKDPVEELMFRNCLDCGQAAPSVPYDPEQYLVDYASGIWALMEREGLQVLTLNPDMTFDLNDEIQGTWSYRVSMEVDNGRRDWYMNITLRRDDPYYYGTVRVHIGGGSANEVFQMEQILEQHYNTEYGLKLNGIYFHDITKLGIEAAREFMKSPEEKIMGTWTCVYTQQSKPESFTQVTDDYSIIFREDGTFHAILSQEYSGTWQFVRMGSGFGEMNYSFSLEPDEEDEDAKEAWGNYRLYAGLTEGGYMTVEEQGNNFGKTYHFSQTGPLMPEDKMEVFVGQWHTVAQQISKNWIGNGWAETGEIEIAAGNSITFYPDGSLEASWDGDKTGRWFYNSSNLSSYDDGVEYMHYMMQFEDQDQAQEIIATKLFPGSTDIILQISQISGNESRTYWLAQCTAEEAEFFVAAGEAVLGSWTGPAFRWNPDTMAYDLPVESWDFRMTFAEDGTLQIFDGTELTGTWEQSLTYDPEEGVGFYLRYNGTGAYDYILCYMTDADSMYLIVSDVNDSFAAYTAYLEKE